MQWILESAKYLGMLKEIYCNYLHIIYNRPFRDNASFIGTTRYASIAAHKGHELGRKDDIESLIYVLLYFMKG